MYFQIKEIVLWPRNHSFPPRILPFELGEVNVISGASRTGKSAIIPIIDYCLGADKCTIPVNTIRDSCEWFGIVIQTERGQKLLARREPGTQKATGDMFILEGPNVEVPREIKSKNTSVDAVKRLLDEFAGLTALDFDLEGSNSGFKGRPSFRDFGAFTFQPQNIVANPGVLFYKADTYEHREKLRTIFPYVLNAITPQLLAKQHELRQLQKELQQKHRELSAVRRVSEEWLAEIRVRISEAKELGLLTNPLSDSLTREQMVDLLKEIVQRSTYEIRVTSETISEAIQELLNLRNEEDSTSLELSSLRRRFAEMSSLKANTEKYKDSLYIQRDRLKISEYLSQTHDPNHNCPICGNSLQAATEQLNILTQSLQQIEKAAGEFDSIPAAFDREYERVRSDMRITSDRLKGIRIRIQSLERSSEEAKSRHYDSLKVSRFLGNLEQSLQTYALIGSDSELSREIEELSERIKQLDKEISSAQVQENINRSLKIVNLNAGKIVPNLDSERPNDPISLLINDLTIKVGGLNREDYLWEIGSGSNWLAYHIAVSLALHQFFLTLKHSPVPSFIVYDQPSQVYFPKRLAGRQTETELDPPLRDEDIDAVQRVFQVFSSVVGSSNGKLQIIVLDHAAENVWGGIENIHTVEEWREGKKLVPIEWLNE